MKLTREEALKVLENHGWTSTQQTATKDGKLVESGHSFDENLGVKAEYSKKAVYEWLGY